MSVRIIFMAGLLALAPLSAGAQTITLERVAPTYSCAGQAVIATTTQQIPDCRFDLRQVQTPGDINLTFDVTMDGGRVQSLRLLVTPIELAEDVGANHIIRFPRAPVLAGLGPNIITQSTTLRRIVSGGSSTITADDAANVWRIAIWAELGRSNPTFPDTDVVRLRSLRDRACQTLLRTYPTLSYVQSSVRRRRLDMCVQTPALVAEAEDGLLGRVNTFDNRLARNAAATTSSTFLQLWSLASEANTIALARANSGVDVSAQVQDLSTLNYRLQQVGAERFPELMRSPDIAEFRVLRRSNQ